MNTGKRPDHCKGCVHFHNAGHALPLKFNAWCCAHGTTASRAIGWCKTHNAKTESQAAQYLNEVEKGLIVDERV